MGFCLNCVYSAKLGACLTPLCAQRRLKMNQLQIHSYFIVMANKSSHSTGLIIWVAVPDYHSSVTSGLDLIHV